MKTVGFKSTLGCLTLAIAIVQRCSASVEMAAFSSFKLIRQGYLDHRPRKLRMLAAAIVQAAQCDCSRDHELSHQMWAALPQRQFLASQIHNPGEFMATHNKDAHTQDGLTGWRIAKATQDTVSATDIGTAAFPHSPSSRSREHGPLCDPTPLSPQANFHLPTIYPSTLHRNTSSHAHGCDPTSWLLSLPSSSTQDHVMVMGWPYLLHVVVIDAASRFFGAGSCAADSHRLTAVSCPYPRSDDATGCVAASWPLQLLGDTHSVETIHIAATRRSSQRKGVGFEVALLIMISGLQMQEAHGDLIGPSNLLALKEPVEGSDRSRLIGDSAFFLHSF
ncbi:poly (ADP ribose) polymerase [Echinococcus multilocularis]|uniref:Poly adp ribose polymerase n=1 Tax=Echinococcus multilocularis TaxID=6211 RepID=A0A0S4MJW2_ECHMU|nr:poly (ADP ribose) polymerase [Echinococcus multilocularis]